MWCITSKILGRERDSSTCPGGEDGYSLNVRTILRDAQDGRWHNASTEWSDAIAVTLR